MSLPDKFKTASPASISIASAAITLALLDELVYCHVLTKVARERAIASARNTLGKWGTQSQLAEAGSLLNALQDHHTEKR
jgi:hypothetical protein